MWNPFARKKHSFEDIDPSKIEPTIPQEKPPRRTHMAEIEHLNATAIVTFTVTDLTGADANERLAGLLEELIHGGSVNIILDVQNVQEMDSACLGTLVKAVRVLEKIGGRMALVNTDRTVQYLFKLTRLDRVFPICTDVMAALEAVERPAARRAG